VELRPEWSACVNDRCRRPCPARSVDLVDTEAGTTIVVTLPISAQEQ